MMQLGFVSAILPDRSFDDVVNTASELGYACVELMCWPRGKAERKYAGVTHIEVDSVDADGAARINETLNNAGVAISGLGYYPNPLAPDPAESQRYVDHLKAVIRAAALIGVRQVNTFIGRDPAKTIDDNWPRFLEVWRPLVQFAEDQGVRIGIENCPMLFTADEWPGGKNLASSPAVWRRIFADLPSDHLGLNYDPSHLVWQGMDYVAPLREFADRLFHIHAKDARLDQAKLNDVSRFAPPSEFHAPKLPGLGDIDWGAFFAELGDIGYAGPVCVEVEDGAYEGSLESRLAALRQCRRYLGNFMPVGE